MIRNVRAVVTAASLFVASFAGVTSIEAQTLELRGRGDVDHDAFLKQLVAETDYLLITRDTTIARGDTVRQRVVVADATLRLNGTILGDLVGVGANLFIRPTATITGETRNIAGGLYKSELSSMAPDIENSPNAPYEVFREPNVVVIRGTVSRSLISPELTAPTYDRVNGLTLRAGGKVLLPRMGRIEPAIHGWGEYYSQRGDFGYGGELELPRGRTTVALGVARTTDTNERWIRSDLSNSIGYLVQGKDRRNYYAVDRGYARIERILEEGSRLTTVSLTGQVEDASPLRAAEPWSLFTNDSIPRPNHYGVSPAGVVRRPAGRITSAILNATSEWERPLHVAEVGAIAELASDGVLDGDFAFARYEVFAEVAMAALRDHTLEVEVQLRGPLPGTDSLPFQRWTYVGGSGTLYTFDMAQFPGDRLAFVETEYSIPMPRWMRLPMLGEPRLGLLHNAGMAWSHDEKPGFEQNVGARLRYNVAYVRVVTNPENFSEDVKVSFGVSFPRGAYPWEE